MATRHDRADPRRRPEQTVPYPTTNDEIRFSFSFALCVLETKHVHVRTGTYCAKEVIGVPSAKIMIVLVHEKPR